MSRGTGPLTQYLIGINLAVFAAVWIEAIFHGTTYLVVLMILNYKWVEAGALWQLFTAMFLHTDPFHILFNMWALWQLGALNERIFTRRQYLTIYLIAGLIGNIASFFIWLIPSGGIGLLLVGPSSLGASGAIFGFVGSWVVSARGTHSYGKVVFYAALTFIMSSIYIGVVNGVAHLFGLVGGYLIARYYLRNVHPAYVINYQVGPPPDYPWQ